MAIIQAHNLRKVYKGIVAPPVEALRGVDLSVDRGQAFGLLGPNGAGKTTLVKILLGLVRASGGSAQILGVPAGTPAARIRVGYMPEHRQYPSFLKARQVIDLFGQMNGIDSATRASRIDAALEQVELADWRDHKVGGFSKGMRQRLALAQALINDPQILFLDEPAEGIDPLGRVVVRNILRRLRKRGTTLFINSHLLTEVEMVCDEVAILHAGRVAESGRLAEMTSREREYRLTIASSPDAVVASLDGAVDGIEEATAPAGLHAWRLTVRDREQLNSAVDRLRSAAVQIEAIEPMRTSLEEVFLKAVKLAEGAAGESTCAEGEPDTGEASSGATST